MITIKSVNYITTDDVEKLTGKHWGDFEFAQMAENDSYQILYCDDDHLEDLTADYEYACIEEGNLTAEDFEDEEEYARHKKYSYAVRLKNEIELIEILRNQFNITDSILVWVSW